MRTAVALTALLLTAPTLAVAQAGEIHRTLRQAQPGIRSCAERAARAGERPGERVEVTARIEPSGRVTEARVSPSDDHPRFARCVASTVKRLRFPRQPAPVTVRFPLWSAR